MMDTCEQIFAMIQSIVATKLNKVSVTWEEVEAIYDSGKYPEINEIIDYIITGKKITSDCQTEGD